MIKGIYTSGSGMIPRMLKQEVFANNMSNSNTVGYKKDSVFLQQLEKAQGNRSIITDLDWEIPMVDEVYIDFEQGNLQDTQNPLNVAIDGKGFFVIDTPQGERYTRNGVFDLTAEGNLIDSNGNNVMSEAGPVVIAGDEIVINQDGMVIVDGNQVASLRVVDFAQPYNLRKGDEGYFLPVSPDDAAQPSEGYTIRQGYVESSNVNIIESMVDMIISFRAYEAGQKAIHSQDETLDKAVNELSRVR